jgi:hypothetical protein
MQAGVARHSARKGFETRPSDQPNEDAMNRQHYKLDHVADALRASAGIPSGAAQILEAAYGHCTPTTVRNYIRRYPRLQKVVEETVELNLDLAESQLIKSIRDSFMPSVFFYLKMRGQQRGYLEKIQHGGTGPLGEIIYLSADDAKL